MAYGYNPTPPAPLFPAAPGISGNAYLEVFVHDEAQGQESLRDPYGNGGRMNNLGQSMFEAAYSAVVMRTRPDITGESFTVCCASSLRIELIRTVYGFMRFQGHVQDTTAELINLCVDRYQWRQNMRGVPAGCSLNDAQVSAIEVSTSKTYAMWL